MTFENMYLYVLPGCPFCAKVDRFMNNVGIEMEHRDASEQAIADELVALGGKLQCPCLVVDGKPMYESMDIINYLNDLIKK